MFSIFSTFIHTINTNLKFICIEFFCEIYSLYLFRYFVSLFCDLVCGQSPQTKSQNNETKYEKTIFFNSTSQSAKLSVLRKKYVQKYKNIQ